MNSTDPRVRRPKDKDVLIQQLRDEAGFPTMRDVLLFAAALGVHRGQAEPFEQASEPIRYETVVDPPFAGSLLQMIVAGDSPEDPEVIAPDRLDEALRAFEAYANGGLSIIQGEINASRETPDQVCLRLVTEVLSASTAARPPLERLVDELTWG